MSGPLELRFVELNSDSLADACQRLIEEGKSRIHFYPFNKLAGDTFKKISDRAKAEFYARRDEATEALPSGVSEFTGDTKANATVLFATDGNSLSQLLMEYLDMEAGTVVAPITERYFKKKPIFLISIPKSGTHLLYELAKAFGYDEGVICPDDPRPGTWYCVEYSNSHTSARDFFIDTVRRSPFGNRHHPFMRSPAVFMYRNPLDILLSEANYYHKDGKTAFYSYLSTLSLEERILRLIDDPWLLGSIRDRVGNFIAWLDFQNVIPVSFEELIGPRGGGDLDVQRRLIWSLQLKLHVPGSPTDFGDMVFNPESPTFKAGQIGGHRERMTPAAMEKFKALNQDFMEVFGYSVDERGEPSLIPRCAEEFRKRPVTLSEADFDGTPILIEKEYLDCAIIKYRGLFYGIPRHTGINIGNASEGTLRKLYSAQDLDSLKRDIVLRRGTSWTLRLRRAAYDFVQFWKRISLF